MRFLLTLLLAACPAALAAQQKKVNFDSADKCRLEAFYLAPSSGALVFVNIHGLGSSKNEWAPFQEELKKAGHGYLSLDLRGHNASRSCAGKPADHKKFSKENWLATSADIEAAAAWLGAKGVEPGALVYCGASIGANLALKAAAEGAVKPGALVLLSPGLDYAGVEAEKFFFTAGAPRALVVAAGNDPYAWESSTQLVKAARNRARQADFLTGGSGHGAEMLKNPRVSAGILRWAGKR